MNLTNKLLITSAAILLTSNAIANDITGTFATPQEGKFLSDTRLGYERTKFKGDFIQEGYYAMETLEYGVTDKFSISAGIANMFDTQGYLNNDHNFAYELGAKYTTKNDRWTYQLAGEYLTYEANEFGIYSHDTYTKQFGAQVKIGYDLDNGWSPYAVYGFNSEIDKADRELTQTIVLGTHRYDGENSLDVAVRYDFSCDQKDNDEWWLDVEYDRYLKDNVTIGVYGSYYLDGKHDDKINYDYDAGVRLKVLF